MNTSHYLFIFAVVALLVIRFVGDMPVGMGGRTLMGGGISIPAKTVRLVMSVVVSIAVLACALWVIMSARYDAASQKWAFSAAGTIVGYWLKGN